MQVCQYCAACLRMCKQHVSNKANGLLCFFGHTAHVLTDPPNPHPASTLYLCDLPLSSPSQAALLAIRCLSALLNIKSISRTMFA